MNTNMKIEPQPEFEQEYGGTEPKLLWMKSQPNKPNPCNYNQIPGMPIRKQQSKPSFMNSNAENNQNSNPNPKSKSKNMNRNWNWNVWDSKLKLTLKLNEIKQN